MTIDEQGQVFSAISAISHDLQFTAQNRTISVFPATSRTIGLTSHTIAYFRINRTFSPKIVKL